MISLRRRYHRSHAPIELPNLGSLIGCSKCWRLLGMRGWAVSTLAARVRCNPDQDMARLIEDCRARAIAVGVSDAERRALDLRHALHGSSAAGSGRHAARR